MISQADILIISQDIFLNIHNSYLKVILRFPHVIQLISLKDVYVYPEISLDLHMISQSDILVISQDIFFNIQTSYLKDILRYPKISFHFHLPCPAALPKLLGWVRLCAPVQTTLLAAGLPMFDLMGPLSVAPLRQVRLQDHRCPAGLPQLLGSCHGPEAW